MLTARATAGAPPPNFRRPTFRGGRAFCPGGQTWRGEAAKLPARPRRAEARCGPPEQTKRRGTRDWSPPARFFCWLLATVNLLIPGGYLLFGAPIGFGDWGDFERGLHPLWAWKIALTALGLAISLAGLRWGAKHLRSLVPSGGQGRRSAWRLTLWPYLTGGFVSMAAAAFNPTSPILIVTSAAAASFGGTCWLLWIGSIVARHPPNGDSPPPLRREPRWMVAGAVALALYLAVLGPGLPR